MAGSKLDKSGSSTVSKKGYDYDDGGWTPEFCKPSQAIPAFFIACSIVTVVAFGLNYLMDPGAALRDHIPHREFYFPNVANFILFYYFLLIVVRWSESDCHVLYEQLWACNSAMLLAYIGLTYNLPYLCAMCCCLVAIDQLLWYVDIIGYVLSGFKKFPTGVAAYMAWPTTSTIKKLTSFHHLWFMPLLLWCLDYRIPTFTFFYACGLSTTLFIIGRVFCPFHCLVQHKKDAKPIVLYLNINGGYAFWKDIKVKPMHWYNHRSPFVYLPFLSIVGNLALNGPGNLALLGLLYGVRTVFNV